MKYRNYLPAVCWMVAITVTMLLRWKGIVPGWVFYTLLIAMHVWIFTKLGMKIYNLKNRINEKENCCG